MTCCGYYRRPASARWRRHAPAHQYHLAAGVGVSDDRSRIIGKDARHRWQVADVAVDHAEERDDGGLVSGDAVEIAHRRALLISVVAHLIVDVGTRIIPTKVFAGISHTALFIKDHTNFLTLLDFCEC
jgi:hypothetical protein